MGRGFRPKLHNSVQGDNQQPKPKIKTFSIIYDKNKFEKYLLNENHPDGKSKAKFFSEKLGYNSVDGKKLYKEIDNKINKTKPSKIEDTQFGKKYVFHIKVKPNNKTLSSKSITVVAIKKKYKQKLRLITSYPYKRRKTK